MSGSRRLLCALAVLGPALITLTVLPHASATSQGLSSVEGAPPTAGAPAPRRILADDALLPDRARGSAIRTWPGDTIRYHETIPRKWDWSLDQALDHWNSSGGDMKFVEVPKSRAQLTIRYGPTYGADGVGTLGYQHRNYVHLSTAYKKADEFEPATRVWVGRLFTHELGHVLGFGHTTGQCSLMFPVYDFGRCPPLPLDKPGYYNCRWIDKPLLRRFTRMYGGSPKRPARHCLIEALPDRLTDVRFGGGDTQSAPVRITWQPPARIRPGTRTRVTVWRGSSCGGALPDSWERQVVVDTEAGSWTDPAYGQGSWCYRLQIENRYGATRPPDSAAMQRYAPVPAAPGLGPLTWHAAETAYHFTWEDPKNTWLYVMRGGPGACATSFDEDEAEFVETVTGTTRRVYAVAEAECLSFFVVAEWGTTSPATQVEVAAPTPAVPELGPLTWRPDDHAYQFTWTRPDDSTDLVVMRDFDDPSSCATTYDEDRAEYTYDVEGDTWQVPGYAVEECLTFFAVTRWGTVSGGQSVHVEVPAPAVTPDVGPITTDPDNPWAATATVTLPDDRYGVGLEVLPGACPATAPADAGWWDGYQADADRWVFYPEAPEAGGANCAMFTALDASFPGLHGPVVMRTFSVAVP